MREGCPFCDYAGPSEILGKFFDDSVYVIEPIKPVTFGHLLFIPRAHIEDFTMFGGENSHTITDTFAAACAWAKDDRRLGARDYNVISSAGPATTQTVRHLHVHLVPRRKGDRLKLPWSTG